jgi:ribosome-associated protein
VQDYGDVIVHVFDPDTRSYYSLEELWADAPRVNWEHF